MLNQTLPNSGPEQVVALVVGARTWTDHQTIAGALAELRAGHPGAVLVHNDDRGAARTAAGIWVSWGLPARAFPAGWEEPCTPGPKWCRPGHRRPSRSGVGTFCPDAGDRRDRRMLNLRPVVCLAFPDPEVSRPEAEGCLALARLAGVPLVIYRPGAGGGGGREHRAGQLVTGS